VTRDEVERVDADEVAGAGEAHRELLGSYRDAAQAIMVERPRRGIRGGALLDLDKGKDVSAPRDEVDLAAVDPSASGEDRPTVEAKPPGGNGLGAAATLFGGFALHSGERSSARA
jgi:hypothetical protein